MQGVTASSRVGGPPGDEGGPPGDVNSPWESLGAALLPEYNGSACFPPIRKLSGRRASCPWTAKEDTLLQRAVELLGPKRWSAIAVSVPGRSGKQCRLRWCNQIDPEIRHDAWSEQET